MLENGDKVLITTDQWFFSNDGQQYRAVFGTIEKISFEDALGFKPRRSENWALKVGSEEKYIILAGCQIHFFMKCDSVEQFKGEYLEKDTGRTIKEESILILD